MTETICASSKIRMMCIHKSHIHEFQRSIDMYSQPQLRLPLGRHAQIPYRRHVIAGPAENPVTHSESCSPMPIGGALFTGNRFPHDLALNTAPPGSRASASGSRDAQSLPPSSTPSPKTSVSVTAPSMESERWMSMSRTSMGWHSH